MPVRDKLYINGRWVPSHSTLRIDVINAVTETVMGQAPDGVTGDVDAAVAAARGDEITRCITSEVGMPLKMSQRIQAALPPQVMASYATLVREQGFEERIGNALVVHDPTGVALPGKCRYSSAATGFSGFWKRTLAGCLFLLGQSAPGYAFPDRPLTLVVPFPATGTADIYGVPRITKLLKAMQTLSTPSLTDSLAQELGRLLTAALGQPVNLERHSNGMTLMGARYTARAKPDGYTLLLAGNPTITIYPALYPSPPFDPLKDLVPVAALAGMPMALVTARANPAATVRQLIEHARFVPGQVNYAAVGDGSTSHLTGELFRAMSGIDIMRVNYNGSTPALNAVVTLNVEFGFVPLTAVLPFLEGGKVRIVAITASERHPVVPQVPTIAESGVTGFDVSGWFGVFAPARTSGAIISLLNYEINRVYRANTYCTDGV